MKILYLANHLPFPPLRGDKMRDYNVVQSLSERHVVDVLALKKHDDPLVDTVQNALPHVKNWLCIPIGKQLERAVRILAVALGIPSQELTLLVSGYVSTLRKRLKKIDYDCIVVSKYYAGKYVADKSRVVIDNIGIESQYYASLALLQPNSFRSRFFRIDSKRIARSELAVLKETAGSIFLSDVDYTIAKERYGFSNRHIIVSQGVHEEQIAETPSLRQRSREIEKEKQSSLLFVGNLTQARNQIPLMEFIQFGKTQVTLPIDFKMVIIGKGAPRSLCYLCDDDKFVYLGFQGEIESWLNATKCIYCYIPGGSGVKTKIIEGIAKGKNVLCDNDSAEAVWDLKQYGILVADSLQKAWEIVLRTDSGGFDKKNTMAGINYIRKNYVWAVLMDRYASFLEKL